MNELNLLYVEDDIEALEDTKYLLSGFFSKIDTATDGEEALEKYNLLNPDVLILDINIPKISGIELAQKIRETNKSIPILFITAYSEKNMLLKAINMAVSGYLLKPYTFEDLKSAVLKIHNNLEILPSYNLNGGFLWNKSLNKLTLKGSDIGLTKNEKLLINVLLINTTKFFTSSELAVELLDQDTNATKDNNIVQLISRFRNKMQESHPNNSFFIENIYGLGYRVILE